MKVVDTLKHFGTIQTIAQADVCQRGTQTLTPRTRLVHSADEYNLHGAKRLFTIPNVLSASCPSVKQDGENKWFLHTDCFT